MTFTGNCIVRRNNDKTILENSTDSFLSSIKIPKIKDNYRDRLEAPISVEEVTLVIKNLKSHSAPGPNGFSAPYYKHFTSSLAPYLVRFFNELHKGNQQDKILNSAFITVIPKPGKDPSSVAVANYHPISLIKK